VLGPDGFGAIRIGMSAQDARTALEDGEVQLGGGGMTRDICHYLVSARLPGIRILIVADRVAQVEVLQRADGPQSRTITDRGLGLGARRAEVETAYAGEPLETAPNHYLGLPAVTLTWWRSDRERGIRYHIDAAGSVTAISAGSASIANPEPCA
jgi:hypothetical protein